MVACVPVIAAPQEGQVGEPSATPVEQRGQVVIGPLVYRLT